MSKISVIIPCYNQGIYLRDAIRSVKMQSFSDYEIIVINDGSSVEDSAIITEVCFFEEVVLHSIPNQGPSAARNYGISVSRGEYILPLDADDKIERTYLERSSQILDQNQDVGIVHCYTMQFGEKKGRLDLPPFNIQRMLLQNCIVNTALFRKSDWKKVGGYNPNMKNGWEDWDFWLSLLSLEFKVYLIPEELFFYRIRPASRNILSSDFAKALHFQLYENHKELFINNMKGLLSEYHNQMEEHSSIPFRVVKKCYKFINGVKKFIEKDS
jgi:glycosyltransferase involved in cell wall biosynthesis